MAANMFDLETKASVICTINIDFMNVRICFVLTRWFIVNNLWLNYLFTKFSSLNNYMFALAEEVGLLNT